MVPSWRKHLEIALRATPPMEICILPTVQPDWFNPLLSPGWFLSSVLHSAVRPQIRLSPWFCSAWQSPSTPASSEHLPIRSANTLQITKNFFGTTETGAGLCAHKFSQKSKVWAVSSACTFWAGGKGCLAKARKQQRYSPLVFAGIQRIGSTAQVCPSTWLEAAPGAAAGLSLPPHKACSQFSCLHLKPETVNPTSQCFYPHISPH